MVGSPPQPVTLLPEDTCATLYRDITRLLPHTYSYRKSFYEDEMSAAIGAAGSMATPAFGLYALPEYFRFRDRKRIKKAKRKVRSLRAKAAEHDCFVRWPG